MNAPRAYSRLRSVDLVRGAACVLMAIDHVRVYSGMPAGGPTPGIFLTRWVTHFVAPIFCLLAGVGAWFLGRRLGAAALARFLVTRGLLLVALELTVIRFLWAFQVDFASFTLAGVIWMLGWCMVLLAAFVRLPARTVMWLGLAIITLQQLFGFVPGLVPESARPVVSAWWSFIYPTGAEAPGGVNVLYVLVPWIGVMMYGYGIGCVLARDDDARRRLLSRLGLGATLAFLVLAGVAAVTATGDDRALWFRMLDQRKYPASQLFLLMTLGPTLVALSVADRARAWWADALVTMGRVPMFYYLAHILAIHVAALLVNVARTGAAHGEWYVTAPYTQLPDGNQWGLSILYLVYALVVVGVLWPACRWYAGFKAAHPDGWTRYL